MNLKLIEKERIRQELRQSNLYTLAAISSSAYTNFLKNENTSFENIITRFRSKHGMTKIKEVVILNLIQNLGFTRSFTLPTLFQKSF